MSDHNLSQVLARLHEHESCRMTEERYLLDDGPTYDCFLILIQKRHYHVFSK